MDATQDESRPGPTFKQTEEEIEEGRLNLAFENLSSISTSLFPVSLSSIRFLDLSHNKFSDLSFLKHFPNLNCLVLDHNKVSSSTTFPTVPRLKVLWLNHNQISLLFPFIQRLKTAFPALQCLSLMANEAVPVNIDESTFYQHLQYRLFVISWFPELQYLDDQAVTDGERTEAHRLYKRPLLERLLNQEPISKVIKTVVSALRIDRAPNSSHTSTSSFV